MASERRGVLAALGCARCHPSRRRAPLLRGGARQRSARELRWGQLAGLDSSRLRWGQPAGRGKLHPLPIPTTAVAWIRLALSADPVFLTLRRSWGDMGRSGLDVRPMLAQTLAADQPMLGATCPSAARRSTPLRITPPAAPKHTSPMISMGPSHPRSKHNAGVGPHCVTCPAPKDAERPRGHTCRPRPRRLHLCKKGPCRRRCAKA